MRTGRRVTGDRQHDPTPGAGGEFLRIAIDDHCCSGSLRSALRAKGIRLRVRQSRLAFAQLLPDETAQSAITFLHAALAFFQKHGVQAQRIYSDNGSCYRSKAMRSTLADLGLKQRFTRPHTPKTNGTAERFIQTSLREWAYSHSDQRAAPLLGGLHIRLGRAGFERDIPMDGEAAASVLAGLLPRLHHLFPVSYGHRGVVREASPFLEVGFHLLRALVKVVARPDGVFLQIPGEFPASIRPRGRRVPVLIGELRARSGR